MGYLCQIVNSLGPSIIWVAVTNSETMLWFIVS